MCSAITDARDFGVALLLINVRSFWNRSQSRSLSRGWDQDMAIRKKTAQDVPKKRNDKKPAPKAQREKPFGFATF